MTDEMRLMYIIAYISLKFCILYDTLWIMNVDVRDVEPGMSNVCFVVRYWGWSRRPGLLLRIELDSNVICPNTKKLLSDVRALLRMIGCLSIRFVQTSSRTFKTFCCWVCFIVDDSIECLLLIIWIVVYSSNIFFVYSWIICP